MGCKLSQSGPFRTNSRALAGGPGRRAYFTPGDLNEGGGKGWSCCRLLMPKRRPIMVPAPWDREKRKRMEREKVGEEVDGERKIYCQRICTSSHTKP